MMDYDISEEIGIWFGIESRLWDIILKANRSTEPKLDPIPSGLTGIPGVDYAEAKLTLFAMMCTCEGVVVEEVSRYNKDNGAGIVWHVPWCKTRKEFPKIYDELYNATIENSFERLQDIAKMMVGEEHK